MNKVFIAIIILAGLAFGAWFLFGRQDQDNLNNQPQPTNVTQTEEEHTEESAKTLEITYSGSQFTPSEISIHHGDTVRFINASDESMWVASDEHPLHQDLPGFDAKRGFGSNETYSFTFTKVGTWGFHDHLNPAATGTIIVNE